MQDSRLGAKEQKKKDPVLGPSNGSSPYCAFCYMRGDPKRRPPLLRCRLWNPKVDLLLDPPRGLAWTVTQSFPKALIQEYTLK